MKRPNILLITSDQHRHDHLGVMGTPGVQTPNLDRLAREGTRFSKAYTSMPTCTPARVTLLTGQYPSVHGAWTIGVSVDPFPRPTIADLLSEQGYNTALFGKGHFVKRADEASHVAGFANPDPEFFKTFRGPYLGFQEVQTSTGHTINCQPDMHYRAFLEEAGVDYREWFPKLGENYTPHNCGPWNIPAEYHDSAWVSNLTRDFIRRQSSEAPWLCWASFQDPHEPFVCPEPWYSKVDPEVLTIFDGPREGEFADKPAFYGEAAKGDWTRFTDGKAVPCSFHSSKLDANALNAMRATLGMIAFMDDRIGAIMRALRETGQADDTIIIYTSDHGEIHGHHGFWGKGLTAYDDCQRVPLIIWGPRRVEAIGATNALANLVDLPRTILNLTGTDIPAGMQGYDLTPILDGAVPSVQDATVIENRATTKVCQQTLVTDHHKLVIYDGSDEGELYDMDSDPDQYRNLWSLPEQQSLKSELLLKLAQTRMKSEGTRCPRTAFA